MTAACADTPGVLYFCSSVAVDGGMELFTLDLVRASVPRWRTHLVLPEAGPLAGHAESAGAAVHVAPFQRVRRPRGFSDLSRFIAGRRNVKAALPRLIAEHRIGLVHFGDIIDAPFLGIAKRAGAKVVCRCNFVPHSKWVQRMLMRPVLRHADRMLPVSHAAARLLGIEGDPRTMFLPTPGPDPDVFSPKTRPWPLREEHGLPPDVRVLGMVARFLEDKGHDRFLDLAGELLAREPAGYFFVLVGGRVAGHESFYAACRRRMEQPPLAGRVRLFENLRQTDPAGAAALASVYRACDAIVELPRCEDTWPAVTLEAMASGIPVAAVDRGGLSEQILPGKTGLLISEGDCGTLMGELHNLLSQPALLRSMGRESRERYFHLAGRERMEDALVAAQAPLLESTAR